MIKIIIYGITGDVDTVISGLNQEVEVIGYADSEPQYNNLESFNYLPFYSIKELSSTAADFFLVLYPSENGENAVKKIVENGVPTEKIINYKKFCSTLLIDPMLLWEQTEKSFDTLLFGMSHSQCGVYMHLLKNFSVFKFSNPSMDLYIQYHIIKRLINNYANDLKQVKNYVIELPYYIFNYDLSKFKDFILTKMNYFEMVGGYHNYGSNEIEKANITEFRNYKKLFGNERKYTKCKYEYKLVEAKSSSFLGPIKTTIKKIKTRLRIAKSIDKVWTKYHKETIDDNVGFLKEIKEMILSFNPDANIVILVCPQNPVFYLFHKKKINKMKNCFYSSVDRVGLQIIDNFRLFKSASLFDDHCHMTANAGIEYSKKLNDILFDYFEKQ